MVLESPNLGSRWELIRQAKRVAGLLCSERRLLGAHRTPRRPVRGPPASVMSEVGDVVGGLTVVTAEGIREKRGDEEPVGPTYRIIT